MHRHRPIIQLKPYKERGNRRFPCNIELFFPSTCNKEMSQQKPLCNAIKKHVQALSEIVTLNLVSLIPNYV